MGFRLERLALRVGVSMNESGNLMSKYPLYPLDFHPVLPVVGEPLCRADPGAARRWRAIREGHTLIAAPTGSGKTLAAFLTSIDQLLREGLESELPDEVRVIYVSPLKALSPTSTRTSRCRAARSMRRAG